MKYEMLFSPMKIGNVEIKNRIVMAPMLMGFGQFNGNATEQMMNYYEERAKGGAGLIVSEVTRVDDFSGATSFGQLAASKGRNIKSISELAARIHRHGAKFFVELHHPGRQNVSLMVNTVPISVFCDKIMPGRAYSKLLYKHLVPPGRALAAKDMLFKSAAPSVAPRAKFAESKSRELSHGEIKKLISKFGDAALRLKTAGVDGIMLHAAHGYLIQQFLSPYINKRTDEYGGSFENRMRFLLEIIADIKEKCTADFPITVRLSVDEMYDKIGMPGCGYTLKDGIKMAKVLEQNGVAAIDVSSAGYDAFNYWLETESFECGWRKNLAAAVKNELNIPVIAANLIRSPEQAEQQLEAAVQDFVSLGRPLIADPYWPQKVQQGRADEIKRCICCLYCIESMMHGAYCGTHGKCSVNPKIGKDSEEPELCEEVKNVVIIGAGVAGLTAGEVLAKRKFNVTVLEKAGEAGGQINLADKSPEKGKIHWCVEDLKVSAQKAGVKIVFNTAATKEIIDSYNPQYVIFATGAQPVVPSAFKADNAVTTSDILSGRVKPHGEQICVIGSGMTGLETAYMLTKALNKVNIIEMAGEIAPGVWFQHLDDILPKLKEAGTNFYTAHKLLKIEKNAIEVLNLENNEKKKIKCSLVVLSMGVKSEDSLYNELKGHYPNSFKIGDCEHTGRIHDATQGAYDLAVSLK
ncbi:MAG: NAD(P)/FAD-dependent oxidoreductase [Clostridiales bacterium]|nr:NAD(P)/FAD-dependent oxidoreductase [Clostridiales bacterium]